jgi:hypothetical protein
MTLTPSVLLIVLSLTGPPLADPAACVVPESALPPRPADRCNAPPAADHVVTSDQLDAIMEWLAERFELPISTERPVIVFENPADLARMRNGGFVTHGDTQGRGDAEQRSTGGDILALYNDARRTIHLSEGWNGTTDAGMSVLVHEMVHHLQNIAGLKYNCAGEREKLAYQAQAAWLRQFGKSLESEFEIDGLSLIVKSNCAM